MLAKIYRSVDQLKTFSKMVQKISIRLEIFNKFVNMFFEMFIYSIL